MQRDKCDVLGRENVTLKGGQSIRLYEINDGNHTKLPSVTTVAHNGPEPPYLKKWRDNYQYWKEYLLYTAIVGTVSHWRVQSNLAKEWDIPPPDLELSVEQRNMFNKWADAFPYPNKKQVLGVDRAVKLVSTVFEEWREKYNPQLPLQSNGTPFNIYPFEILVYSMRYYYAGSVDLVCSINGINWLIDIKTSNNMDQTYKLQLTAYYLALTERYPTINIKKMAIINIPQYEMEWNFTEAAVLKEDWLEKVRDFYLEHGNEKPMSFHRPAVLQNLKEDGIK